MKQCVLSESYRAHRLLADRVLDDGNFSDYCLLLPSESYVAGSRVMKEFTFGGMKVRLWRSWILRSNQRIQDFIHWYHSQSHMKSHEKESIHPIALSPNISSVENETKSPLILICNEKKNQIFYMLWQYKLDKNFNLTFKENRSLLSSIWLPRYASKCWWNHLSTISLQLSSIWDAKLQSLLF